jgi:FixJ family two-component response regulator
MDLTDREREVAKLAATGMTRRQIAEALELRGTRVWSRHPRDQHSRLSLSGIAR